MIDSSDFPEYDMPYLKTFYPGVRNYSEAQIIEIKQGQNLSDITFQMTEELPQRKIQGKVVWASGKPVTEMDNPFLTLYNLKVEYVDKPLNFLRLIMTDNFPFHFLKDLHTWSRLKLIQNPYECTVSRKLKLIKI